MKILFLSQRFILPMDTGGKIRTGNILKQLADKHYIKLISNVEESKDIHYIPGIRSFCSDFIAVPWKEIKKNSPLFWVKLLLQMFSIYPVNVLNDCSRELRFAVERECFKEKIDLVICDFVQSALMLKGVIGVPAILFQHNVESMILHRHLERSRNPVSRLFWWLQWKKMASYEKKKCREFDKIIAVSDNDRMTFERLYGLKNVVTIPTGVDIDYYKPMIDVSEKSGSLVFCGSMDWLPNEDATVYFIEDVLPSIRKKTPEVTLTVVGRNPSQFLKRLAGKTSAITLTGWVDDVRPYLAEAAVIIVPIRIGGGTRMKIYEAMAMGKAVISTSIGAEGLPVTNKENIFIEDNAAAISQTIIELLQCKETKKSVGRNARSFVQKRFSWEKVGAEFERICRETVQEAQFSIKRRGV